MQQLYILLLLAMIVVSVPACSKLDEATETISTSFTEPTIYITVQPGAKPQEYTALVSASRNPGVAGYNLALSFDSAKLTPVKVNEGVGFNSGMVFMSNLMGATEEKISAMNTVTTVWAAAKDIADDGALYSVTFRATPNASGQTELNLLSRGIGNAAESPVAFILKGAVIDFDGDVSVDKSYWHVVVIGLLITAITIFAWIMLKKMKQQHV